ncbi:pyroglutamyl-peptidase I [Pontibacillus salicampi]|uniref:Pyroglutamyl-peptidase I n=1 Tax=Pontibacillus salicampi TaxID=1449801 RepID=A0ABV6LSK9_9BACI
MKKVLVTGFEPFLHYPVNPTMEIVRELDEEQIGEYTVVTDILPVDFRQSGRNVLERIAAVKPDAVIALGLAAGRSAITPERIAVNCNDGDKDNEGNVPGGEKIREEGPDGIFSTLPIQEMVERLKHKGYPAHLSNSAGTYLCNHVMYEALYSLQHTDIPAGFIHIPASHTLAMQVPNIPSWSQSDLTESIRVAISCLSKGES